MTFLEQNILVDGVRLAYRDRGQGEPVIFVHGTPSYSYEWRNVVPHIEAAGYRTITYDLLGFGQSERPAHRDTSVPAQTDLLRRLLDVLSLGSVCLVAHDIGGAMGQRLAVSDPERVRRLMLMDTVSYDSWPSPTWREIIRNGLDAYRNMSQDEFDSLLTRQLRMAVSREGNMTGEVLDAYLAPHRSALGRISFFDHQVRHYDSKYTEEIVGDLSSLTMPVQILWGEDDAWQPIQYAHRLNADIPGSRLVAIPRSGHFVMEDAPERVVQEILGFLAQ